MRPLLRLSLLLVLLLAAGGASARRGKKKDKGPWFCRGRTCPCFKTVRGGQSKAAPLACCAPRRRHCTGVAWGCCRGTWGRPASSHSFPPPLQPPPNADRGPTAPHSPPSAQLDDHSDYAKRCYARGTWAVSCSWGAWCRADSCRGPAEPRRRKSSAAACEPASTSPTLLNRPTVPGGYNPAEEALKARARVLDYVRGGEERRRERGAERRERGERGRRAPPLALGSQASSVCPPLGPPAEHDLWGSTPFATIVHTHFGGEQGQQAACNTTSPGAPAAAAAALGEAMRPAAGAPPAEADEEESLGAALSAAAALGGCAGFHRTICSAYFLGNVRELSMWLACSQLWRAAFPACLACGGGNCLQLCRAVPGP